MGCSSSAETWEYTEVPHSDGDWRESGRWESAVIQGRVPWVCVCGASWCWLAWTGLRGLGWGGGVGTRQRVGSGQIRRGPMERRPVLAKNGP